MRRSLPFNTNRSQSEDTDKNGEDLDKLGHRTHEVWKNPITQHKVSVGERYAEEGNADISQRQVNEELSQTHRTPFAM